MHWPGTRPLRWWQYDAPAPRRPGQSEYEYLRRHNLLTAAEKRHGSRRRASFELRRRSNAALRRHRERERNGRSLYSIEHDVVDLEEMLRAAGLLGDGDDHATVQQALQQLIDLLIREHKTKLCPS
jgi:hypothetical protein